jgi:hypothetical protein
MHKVDAEGRHSVQRGSESFYKNTANIKEETRGYLEETRYIISAAEEVDILENYLYLLYFLLEYRN